ncbi:MAG: PilZ domain-containing protein [Bryobacteraceae bacterium]
MIEQRKARRFELKLPFELVRSGSQSTSRSGETRNLSSVGVLFAAEAEVSIGDPVEYMITLPTPPETMRVRIRCLGKIVRLGKAEVAATLERYEFVRNGKVLI